MTTVACQKTEGRRHLLRSSLESEPQGFDDIDSCSFARCPEHIYADGAPSILDVLTRETECTLKEDENRNSMPNDTDAFCIPHTDNNDGVAPDRKGKTKRASKITSFKNLVKVSVSSAPPVELLKPVEVLKRDQSEESQPEVNVEEIREIKVSKRNGTGAGSGNGKKSIRSANKSYRKRRNRKSKAIQNEGAPLWSPVEEAKWRSTGGRLVKLDEIPLNLLCDAERATLKQHAVEVLASRGLGCPIMVPKEHQVAVRRKWKALLQLGKKTKVEGSEKDKESVKPPNPVFSISLYQVIENDKTLVTEQAKMADMFETDDNGSLQEAKSEQLFIPGSRKSSKEEEGRICSRTRRNSEPNFDTESSRLFDFSYIRDKAYCDNFCDYMYALRTIDSVKEEDEDENRLNRRKSRLIEALSLSSTSASSLCILDKEREFNAPPPQVPRIIIQAADYITKYALHTIGIFRTGGSKKRVRQMKDDYNNGLSGIITKESNPNDVAELLKDFLRSLPDPLLTRELYNPFLAAAHKLDEETILTALKQLVWLLPVPNQDTLKVVLSCLAKVAQNAEDKVDGEGNLLVGNKMDSLNLATLMAPNILHRCKECKNPYQVDDRPEDTRAQIQIVRALIEHHEELFRVPAETHHRILEILLEADPETVDYVLKRKAARSNLNEILNDPEDGLDLTQAVANRLPSKARYSAGDEVEFRKSNSFSSTPYKPFVRRRKDSNASRPTSTRSDPPDRSSIRTSSFGTPSSKLRSSRVEDRDFAVHSGEKTTSSLQDQYSISPRDSGVVLDSSPPLQRHSLRRSLERREICLRKHEVKEFYATMLSPDASFASKSPMASPKLERTTSLSKNKILRRQQSGDRESRDSAYDSGMTGMFSQGSCEVSSIQIEQWSDDIFEKGEVLNPGACLSPCQNLVVQTASPKPVSVFPDEHLLKAPNPSPRNSHRKISLPPQYSPRILFRKSRARAKSGNDVSETFTELKSSVSEPTPQTSQIDWSEHWPHWTLNPRQSQFPTKETDL